MIPANIVFIGGGNMASAIIAGLVKQDYPTESISVVEPNADKCQQLQQQYAIQTSDTTETLLKTADVIVLAVKPQIMQSVCHALIIAERQNKPLFISIAVGISENSLNNWLGESPAIVRCMPNTPALVGYGASGLFANQQVTAEQKQIADRILTAVGITVWVDQEADIDKIAAVSGSGPAYFFLTIEALQKAGLQLGLPETVVKQLSLQTALGSAIMANASDQSVEILRKNVTSPGGTTEQAIKVLQEKGLLEHYQQALSAAVKQADVLAKQLA